MSHKSRIVIAEDEQIIALGMQIFLSEAGHEVCGIAKTAAEAVRLVERHQPDLALLDVRLENSDGRDAAREIRAAWGIPAILVTGHLDRLQAEEAGAVGLLKKPYEPRRLLDMIETVMRWLEGGAAGDLPAGMFPEAIASSAAVRRAG